MFVVCASQPGARTERAGRAAIKFRGANQLPA